MHCYIKLIPGRREGVVQHCYKQQAPKALRRLSQRTLHFTSNMCSLEVAMAAADYTAFNTKQSYNKV